MQVGSLACKVHVSISFTLLHRIAGVETMDVTSHSSHTCTYTRVQTALSCYHYNYCTYSWLPWGSSLHLHNNTRWLSCSASLIPSRSMTWMLAFLITYLYSPKKWSWSTFCRFLSERWLWDKPSQVLSCVASRALLFCELSDASNQLDCSLLGALHSSI